MAHQDNNKISPLENDYHREKLATFQKEQKRLIFKRRRLFLLFLVAVVIFAFAGYSLLNDQKKLSALEKEQTTTISTQQELAEQEQGLQDDVDLLQNEDYVGKLARARYLLSKDGESVYTLPSTTTTDDSTAASATTTDSSQASSSGENK